MIEPTKNINSSKKNIKDFGISFGVILLIIAGFLFYKDHSAYNISLFAGLIFIFLGVFSPIILKPLYKIWMIFAVIIGAIMTRIILTILFFLVMTPIGLFTRLIGRDFLNLKITNQSSYWNSRVKKDELNQNYEKQF